MDVTPSSPSPKQTKSKPKVAAAPKAAAPKKEPAKKTAASAPAKTKKTRVAPPAAVTPVETLATPVEVLSTSGLSLTDLQHEIAIAAYFLAEQRNFAAGHELDDWLQAERQVRARIA